MRYFHRRNPEPYCQCHLRRNLDESIPGLLARVRAEISRLCQKYQCEPEECYDICSPGNRRRRGRKNPMRRWSRPLSAGLARLAMGEPFEEEEQVAVGEVVGPPRRGAERQILVVGGDATYIPDWLRKFSIMQLTQVDVDLERQLGHFRPDLILVFVKATEPFRPTRHTTYRVQNYARGDNSEGREVPRITIHKGWSHAVQRAQELGVDWFVSAYPDPIYIPEEDLTPRIRSKAKPGSPVNIRRAMQFEAQGITANDVAYAKTRYVLEEPSHCSLCGTKIKYQFRLMFDRPDQPEPIVFFPVGSVCIMDWVEALPDTPRKLVLLRQLQNELQRAEEAQAPKKASSAEARKTKKKQLSEGIRKRNEERKKKIAERKAENKKKKGGRRGRAAEFVEPPLPPGSEEPRSMAYGHGEIEDEDEGLRDKFDKTQQEFGWD